MRYAIPAFAALMLAVSPLAAQTTPAPAAPTTSGTPTTGIPTTGMPTTGTPTTGTVKPPRANRLDARFTAANTTHDGHLTLEQAKAAKWRVVARHFDQIDTDKKGYVTEADIRTANAAARAAKAQKS